MAYILSVLYTTTHKDPMTLVLPAEARHQKDPLLGRTGKETNLVDLQLMFHMTLATQAKSDTSNMQRHACNTLTPPPPHTHTHSLSFWRSTQPRAGFPLLAMHAESGSPSCATFVRGGSSLKTRSHWSQQCHT